MIKLLLFLLGLIFGSFINALVWRYKKQKNWVNERSICPKCKHQLAAIDLVPLLSWLSLRGKCRYCKKAISVQYPLVELLTGVVFAVSYTWWPYNLSGLGWAIFIIWLCCLVVMVALLVYDTKWMLLPDKIVGVLTALSAVFALSHALSVNKPISLVISILSGMIFLTFFWLLFQISKGNWIGGGDVKMAFALGLLVGTPFKVLLTIFIASLVGTIIAIPLMLMHKTGLKKQVPFGPMLIVATVIVVLWGTALIEWYTQTFLYI